MSGIIPIPNTRVSGLLMRQRLTQQLQGDQLDLFRLQEQIASGQRIVLPSDDGPAALRAISLQRLIERKTQLSSNVRIGKQFLAATDTALQDVATKLSDIKGSTLGVAGTLSSDVERNAAISEINSYLENLVKIANRQFQGRHLFAGTKTGQEPYALIDGYVYYQGDDGSIRSYSDFGVTFVSNATGQDVFGGASAQVTSDVDLNPELSRSTSLSSLRGGRGIKPGGALSISDGSNVSIVDISGARTIGDVVRLIEENPPAGRQIIVDVTAAGLNLRLADSSLGGNLNVTEVANGTTAKELGILQETGVGTGTIIGGDLNPKLLKTNRLDSFLGSKARTTIHSGSYNDNNDILLESASNGTAFNGVAVQYVDDELLAASAGVSAGNEYVEYDTSARASTAALSFSGTGNDLILTASTTGTTFNNVAINIIDDGSVTGDAATVNYDNTTKRLNIYIDGDSTTIGTIEAAINLEGTFLATPDTSIETYAAGTVISSADVGIVQGNTGNSGGAAKTLYIYIESGASTADQVVDAINAEGTFTAQLNPNDSSSAVKAGTGTVSLSATAELTSGGSGETLDLSSGLRIVNAGQTYDVKFDGAETVEDLLNILNTSVAGLQAELNDDGTGINIRSRVSGADFQIGENGGTTAAQLGVRTYDETTKLSSFNYGVGVLTQEGFNLPTTTGTDITITASDGTVYDIDLSTAESLADVVAIINGVTGGAGTVEATLAPPGNIVRLEDQLGGAGFLSLDQASGSLAAQYLGLVPGDATSFTATGTTILGDDGNYVDFTISASDGSTYGIDISNAKTVGDVIDAINAITGGAVTAELSPTGNGVLLTDTTGGVGDLVVTQALGSQAAELFGFVPRGETTKSSTSGSLTSSDQNYIENESVFNTLIRLRDALVAQDLNGVERALVSINDDIDRVTFARADIGSTLQGLELSEQTLQDEDVQLRSSLSEEIDVDLVSAISDLTARQIAMQASLQVTGNLLQLTLLDFI